VRPIDQVAAAAQMAGGGTDEWWSVELIHLLLLWEGGMEREIYFHSAEPCTAGAGHCIVVGYEA
jgi:hypothetical protein